MAEIKGEEKALHHLMYRVLKLFIPLFTMVIAITGCGSSVQNSAPSVAQPSPTIVENSTEPTYTHSADSKSEYTHTYSPTHHSESTSHYTSSASHHSAEPSKVATSTQTTSQEDAAKEQKYASEDAEAAAKCAAVPTTHAAIPKQPSAQTPLPSKVDAIAQLNGLQIGKREGYDTYCREAFGEALEGDFDQNGCSARQDALKRTATDMKTIPVKRQYGTCQEVLSATWTDPYGGKVIHIDNMKGADSDKIQIDHVVPLYNAWVSGADKWTPEERAIFAADVSDWELLAVDADQNQAKGNSSPDKWKPADNQCQYAKQYTQVKSKYKLLVTTNEKAALAQMLNSCQS
ncbi:MAG: HNH endonuclease family protein [Micrococcaceae bacterium]